MDQPIFEKVLSVIKDLVADNGTDAVSLLKADHRKVEGLFKEYEKSEDNDDKRAILQQIIKELTVHTTVEESKVYPILEHKDVEGSNEAYEEHHLVKVILDELVNMDVASPLTDAKVKALSELVKHHVQEEELELLPELQSMDIDLEELGSVIVEEKGRLRAQGKDSPASKDVSTKNLKKVGAANAVSAASISKSKSKKAPAKKAPAKSPVAKAKAIATEVTSKAKAVTKKPVAKAKAIAKKAVSEVKSVAKEAKDKLSGKKAAAKSVAKKPAVKKAVAKKTVTKKTAAKPVAKKPVAKKAAVKPVAKKAAAKTVVKKSAAAKPVAKKAATKPTPITKKAVAKKPLARKKAS
jgi:hemerythrin superfamily protein